MFSFPYLTWPICFLLYGYAPLLSDAAMQLPEPVLLHQFPNGSWVENVATLRSGKIIVTLLNAANLVLIDPDNPEQAKTIFHDTIHTSLLGLAQPDDENLAAVVGNFDVATQTGTPGSYGISLFHLHVDGSVRFKSTFQVREAQMLDGLSALPRNPSYVLAADSKLGAVWRIDLRSGKSNLAFNSTLLHPTPGNPEASVNGIHAQDNYLYFTNSNKRTFGRILMTPDGMPVHGVSAAGELIVQDFNGTTYDDFALGPDKSNIYYLCSATGLSINRVDSVRRTQTICAGGSNDAVFDHPIAAQLGRSSRDSRTLYVTTAGTIPGVGGSGGGQVFAVDTTKC